MENSKEFHQIDLDTPEGRSLIKVISSGLKVNIGVNGTDDVLLDMSIDQVNAYEAFSEFLRQSVLKGPNFLNGRFIDGKNGSQQEFAITDNINLNDLTPKEIEIMEMLSDGMPLKTIAGELGICLGTVKSHLKSIYKKLKVRKAPKAVIEYLKLKGMIHNPLEGNNLLLAQLCFKKIKKLIRNDRTIQ